jgi:hypothetical protein
MIGRTPPPVAAWLLKRLSKNDALVGDLMESYADGHSTSWYWRQVITAVVLASRYNSLERRVMVGATGLLVFLCGNLLAPLLRSWLLYEVVQPAAWNYPFVAAHPFIALWTIDVTPLAVAALLSGWIVGLMLKPHQGVLSVLASLLFVGLATRSVMAAIALFDNPKHIPLHYFVLMIGTEILLLTILVIV